jgi:homoserine O-acetyltransferase
MATERTDCTNHVMGDAVLQHGVLPSARLAFKAHGKLNAARDNAILFPTWFSGQHQDLEWVIGPDHALDPRRYFIIAVNIIGNGVSSSPSNQPSPFDGARFPRVTVLDNVILQHRLLNERFGISKLLLVVGRSMGAQIAFQWGCYFPDLVASILPLCGSARTSPHNYVFLQTVKMALRSDPAWREGHYVEEPFEGLKRMQMVFDSWGLSQAFYLEGLHLQQGFNSIDEFLARDVPGLRRDANDYLAQIQTWEYADFSANPRFNKDFVAALNAIKARAIVMPSRTDLYFPPEDSAFEVQNMPNAELRVVPSIWGHRAGAPGGDPRDIAFFNDAIAELLSSV